jgi:DNA-binding transcriptional MerR regulator
MIHFHVPRLTESACQLKYASSQEVETIDRELLSITEVGEATGLQSSALRYYEKAGLIEQQGRMGGRRHYEPSVLQRLTVIALLQEVGFTIGEISELLKGKGSRERWRTLAEGKARGDRRPSQTHRGRTRVAHRRAGVRVLWTRNRRSRGEPSGSSSKGGPNADIANGTARDLGTPTRLEIGGTFRKPACGS